MSSRPGTTTTGTQHRWLRSLIGFAGHAVLLIACLAGALWALVELIGYPTPPPRPATGATAGSGFRVEHGRQHVAHLQGEPYALGFHNARLLGDLMRAQEESLFDGLFAFARSPAKAMSIRHVSLVYLAGLDQHLTLEERQEILGLAEGVPDPYPDLGPRYARLAGYHALHELSQRFAFDSSLFACSFVAVGQRYGKDGHAFLARNFEWEGGDAFDGGKVVLAVAPSQGHGFVSIVWAGMAGAVSGMNDAGLAIVMNAGAASDYNRVGTPTSFLVRRALQYATTIPEAVAIMTASPRFVTDIIGMADRTGAVAVLELTPNRFALRRGELLMAANQLETPELRDDRVNLERQKVTTTAPRRRRLAEIEATLTAPGAAPVGAEELLAIMRDRRGEGGRPLPVGHRHALDAIITTHSVIMDATAGVLWVSEGPQTLGPYHAYDVAALVRAQTPAAAQAATLVERDLPADPLVRSAPAIAYGRMVWKMAQADLKAGQPAAARDRLATMPAVLADHPTTLLLTGETAAALGEREAAIAAWQRALAAPPEYAAEATLLLQRLAAYGITPAE